jgi:ATP/maltotriose-dependent transcriptional regulator MalT
VADLKEKDAEVVQLAVLERLVIMLITQGHSREEIAEQMGLRVTSIDKFIDNVNRKIARAERNKVL